MYNAIFTIFFGENVFRADMCNADVKLAICLFMKDRRKMAEIRSQKSHADKTY
ncbi:hypothetical protein ACNKHU_18025 [Shigella flexneri]